MFRDIRVQNRGLIKAIVFWASLAIAILLAAGAYLYPGLSIIYINYCYIPIILSGIWYQRKAIFVGGFLGLFQIFVEYAINGMVTSNDLIIAVVFVLISLIVGVLSYKKDDICKRFKDTMNRLNDFNKRLTHIIELYPDPTLIIDNNGYVIAWNKAMEELTGIKAVDMIGKGNYEYSMPFYGERKPMLIDRVNAPTDTIPGYDHVSIKNETIEAVAVNASIKGQEVVLWATASKLYDADNQIIGAIESIRDATAQKRLEEKLQHQYEEMEHHNDELKQQSDEIAYQHEELTGIYNKLKESEEKYRLIMSSVGDGIFIIDLQRRITFINLNNPRVQKLTGFTEEEVVGHLFDDFIVKEYVDFARDKFNIGITGAPLAPFELEIVTGYGKHIPIELNANAMTDINGKITGGIGAFRDITERRVMEEEIIRAYQMTHQILEKAPLGIYVVEEEGGVEYVNQSMRNISAGDEPEDMRNVNVLELHTYKQLGLDDKIRAALKGDYFYLGPVEYGLDHSNDSRVRNFMGIPMEENGKKKALIFVEDVTESKRMEQMLLESEEKFRSLVETCNDIIWETDRNMVFTYVSPRVSEVLGYTSEDLVGMSAIELLPSDLAKELALIINNPSVTKTPFMLQETDIPDKNGNVLIMESNGSPMFDEHGDFRGYRGITRDITEHKIADETMRVSEERYRLLSETSRDLIFIMDSDLRVQYINHYAADSLGKNPAEVTGKHIKELYPPETYELQKRHLMMVFESGKAFSFEDRIKLFGREAWVNTQLVPMKASRGEVTAVMGVSRDITGRKMVEAALLLDESRLEALLKLNEMKNATQQEIVKFALDEGVRLSGSQVGYVAFTNEDESALFMYAWSDAALKDCHMDQQPRIFPVDTTGLWGEAVRQRMPIITNDYEAEDTLKKGLPEGHMPLKRHMNVPLFDGDHIVAVAGVGNKSEEYDQADVRQLTLLMSGMWRAVQRKRAEDAIQMKNRELELVNSITSTINRTKNMKDMFDRILMELLNLLDMDAGAIYLYDTDDGKELRLAASSARNDAGEAISYRMTLDKDFRVPDWVCSKAGGSEICNMVFNEVVADICVPLYIKEGAMGIMAFYSSRSSYFKGDSSALMGIGAQLGIAIENHRLFKKIHDTSDYLADIINESPDAMMTIDKDGQILLFNKSASRLLKYSPEEVTGMKLSQLLPAGQDLDLTEKRNLVREFVSKDGSTTQLNVSSSRMYKDDATGINIITLKDLSEIRGLKITPIVENAIETTQLYHLEPGGIYMVDKQNGPDYMEIFADQVKHNIQGLYVTRQNPKRVREQYGLEKTPIIWLNASECSGDENCIKPDNLSGLGATLSKFMAEANDGLILLDGTEYLMMRNSFDSLLKFVHFLNDRLMQSNCRVVFCMDTLTLDERQHHMLLSEMRKFDESDANKIDADKENIAQKPTIE